VQQGRTTLLGSDVAAGRIPEACVATANLRQFTATDDADAAAAAAAAFHA